MDITFACKSCGQSIVIDEAGAGAIVDCPKCGTTLEVPHKSEPLDKAPQRMKLCPDCGQMLPASALACDCGWDSSKRPPPNKNCPYCAEEIRRDAVKCKHCGEFLNGSRRTQSSAPAPPYAYQPIDAQPKTVSEGNIAAAYILAIIVPFIGFFVGLYLLAKKEPGHGVACMAISVFAFFLWCALLRGC
jgi:hypothetical protein